MRFSPIIFAESLCINILLVSRIYTSFYAGFNAVFERDLKKLIALSTLSHLGFIGLALSTGNINLAFFHLLTHALFKSLLFMAMGDIITNLRHSQDIRWLSQGAAVTPLSSGIIAVSIFNLLGLPGISGFFSKDLVLESLNFSNLGVVLLAVIFTNVLFTFFYTLQLFYFIFQPIKAPVLLMVHKVSWPHATRLVALACLSTSFRYGYLASVSCFTHSPIVPFLLKAYPLLACVTMLSFMFLFGQLPASLKVSR